MDHRSSTGTGRPPHRNPGVYCSDVRRRKHLTATSLFAVRYSQFASRLPSSKERRWIGASQGERWRALGVGPQRKVRNEQLETGNWKLAVSGRWKLFEREPRIANSSRPKRRFWCLMADGISRRSFSMLMSRI